MPELVATYRSASRLTKESGKSHLRVVTAEEAVDSLFIRGELANPYLTAQQMLLVARVAGTRYYVPPAMVARLIREADPVISCDGETTRMESFSPCCGVYARLDLSDKALIGEKQMGTTNVDFNQPFKDALSKIGRDSQVEFSASNTEVTLLSDDVGEAKEKKVDLPERWFRGFAEVQHLLSQMDQVEEISKPIFLRFLNTLTHKNSAKEQAHLEFTKSGIRKSLKPNKAKSTITVGGASRLKLLTHLIPHSKSIQLCYSQQHQSVCVIVDFGESRFHLAISPYLCRGFSGEGQLLRDLVSEPGESDVAKLGDYLQRHPNSSQAAVAKVLSEDHQAALSVLSVRGMIGYDNYSQSWFYRKLPFDSLGKENPRLAGAKKLVDSGAVDLGKTSAKVKSQSTIYQVDWADDGSYNCNCPWHLKTQGEQGPCKHILAVMLDR